jgi:hypothetical protein
VKINGSTFVISANYCYLNSCLASLFFIRTRNKKKEQETFDGNKIVVANQDELNEP